ncbi:MAG: hypothetical protein ACRENP_30375, partial [Longimicrobiales bacterium]
MPAIQTHRNKTERAGEPATVRPRSRARLPLRRAVDLLLAISIPMALVLVFTRGAAHGSTALAVVLGVLAARVGGLSAALVFVPLALLPVYTLTEPTLSWARLVLDVVIALSVAALVADLRSGERRAQQHEENARRALRDEQHLRHVVRLRLASYRRRMQRRESTSSYLATGQMRRLADAPLQWLADADFANVYDRI